MGNGALVGRTGSCTVTGATVALVDHLVYDVPSVTLVTGQVGLGTG